MYIFYARKNKQTMERNKIKSQLVCFSKGTKVHLSSGKEKDIEKISVGDEILNFNSQTGNIEKAIVEKIAASYHSVVNKISFSNGSTLVSTTDHPYFVVGKGWASVNSKMTNENYNLNVQELVEGDICLSYRDDKTTEVIIEKIDTLIEDQKMYVISGGKNNNFFANGIVVSDENLMALNLENINIEFKSLIS